MVLDSKAGDFFSFSGAYLVWFQVKTSLPLKAPAEKNTQKKIMCCTGTNLKTSVKKKTKTAPKSRLMSTVASSCTNNLRRLLFFLSLLGSLWHLSTAATYCPGSFGCCSSRHSDHLRLCCHGDGCWTCLSAGGSRPSCAADGGWTQARRRSADSCRRGQLGAGRGCYDAAWKPSVPISHLQASAG